MTTEETEITPLTKEMLSQYNDEYYKEMDKRFENIYIEKFMVTDIDILRYKIENYYYTDIKDVLEDVNFMFRFTFENLSNILGESSKIESYRNYLTTIYIEIIKTVNSFKKEFRGLFINDINDLINTNKMPKISKNLIT
jgi:hypothetical protein